MGSSPLELSKSPVGPLAESSRCASPPQARLLVFCTQSAEQQEQDSPPQHPQALLLPVA